MENQQTLTNNVFRKIPFILAICPCLLIVAFSRGKLSNLLKSIPHNNLFDFAWNYMATDSHQLLLILLPLLLVFITMGISTYILVKNFKDEEKQGKILNILLILSNISVIFITILLNLITFKIIFVILIISSMLFAMLSGINSSENS